MLDDLAVLEAEVRSHQQPVRDDDVVLGDDPLDVDAQVRELRSEPSGELDERLGAIRACGLCWTYLEPT